jgi:hypothetical protein
MVPGKKYKVLVTLWGAEVAIFEGEIIYPGRTIWGTCIYDGHNAFCISVNICPKEKVMQVFAVNPVSKRDFSPKCRLLKIYESQ